MGKLKLNKNEFSFLNGLEIDKQVTGNNTHSKLRVEK